VRERQQVCPQALVAALVESLLLDSPGLNPAPQLPTPELPTASECATAARPWSLPVCPWVLFWLAWPSLAARLQGGLPQRGSTKRVVPQSLARDVVPHDVLGAEVCLSADRERCELACSQLGPLW